MNSEKNNSKKGVFKIENYHTGEYELIIPPYKKITAFKSFPIEIDDIDIGSQLLIHVLKLTSVISPFIIFSVFSHNPLSSVSILYPPKIKLKNL